MTKKKTTKLSKKNKMKITTRFSLTLNFTMSYCVLIWDTMIILYNHTDNFPNDYDG